MSKTTQELRQTLERSLDMLEMAAFNDGFEACIDGIDELSNKLHNEGNPEGAIALAWAVKELRGENA